jgi:hypothetical protein
VYVDLNVVSASWPKQPPEFGVRPDLPCLQPTGIEYRGFYLSASINSISATVRRATNQDIDIGHRNPLYADRNLVSVSWPEQPPEFGV